MTQVQALEILKTGANVFLTGEPGSGKTHTINSYVSFLRQHGVAPSITASTGIAATHIAGMTIHSWSGIGIKNDLTSHDVSKIVSNAKIAKRIKNSNVLIIDEISMLSAQTLNMVDIVCRETRKIFEPFGGMQVVFVGDFFQLPPVVKNQSDNGLFTSENQQFAFKSRAWSTAHPVVCYLTEQHRQDDKEFLLILEAIRRGEFTEDHKFYLENRLTENDLVSSSIPRLFPHNIAVDALNAERLARLPGDKIEYVMTANGGPNLVEALKKGCLSPERLYLKKGASVLFTKNNPQLGFANGTLGIVRDFKENKYPIVQVKGGRYITVSPMEWGLEENGIVLASITQIPLRLAWAITIHKSQGMSMDAAAMDLSRVFEYGQGYVALSRVRRLSGLHLFSLDQNSFHIHPEVMAEDSIFRSASESAQDHFGNMPEAELATMQKSFLTRIGGTELEMPVSMRVPQRHVQHKEKGQTFVQTLELWKQGKKVHEIAEIRKLAKTTILTHIEHLFSEKQIVRSDIYRIVTPELINCLDEVYEIFKEVSTEHLSPVFARLGGKISFDEIRIARMLYQENAHEE